MKLVIIGSGYVGLVTGCCLAEAGNEVVCVDHDVRKLAALREGRLPFLEPELQDVLVEQCAAGRLKFESAIGRAMPGAECVFLCVGTPAQKDGNANLDNLLLCVRELADTAFEECIVVIKSTVPVGTSDRIEAIKIDQIQLILGAFRYEAVCLLHNVLFNDEALIGKMVSLFLMLPSHFPKGMKSHCQRR